LRFRSQGFQEEAVTKNPIPLPARNGIYDLLAMSQPSGLRVIKTDGISKGMIAEWKNGRDDFRLEYVVSPRPFSSSCLVTASKFFACLASFLRSALRGLSLLQ